MTRPGALVALAFLMISVSWSVSFAEGPDGRAALRGSGAEPPPASVPTARYDPKGRRDPFQPPEAVRPPVQGLTVAAARLKGIVRGGATRALLETPDGIGYIMQAGDTLGNGRLIEIGVDRVVFRIPPRQGSTTDTVVLRLSTE